MKHTAWSRQPVEGLEQVHHIAIPSVLTPSPCGVFATVQKYLRPVRPFVWGAASDSLGGVWGAASKAFARVSLYPEVRDLLRFWGALRVACNLIRVSPPELARADPW